MALKSLKGIKPNLKEELIAVDEIEKGGEIIVREMTSRRLVAYQKAMKEHPDFPVEHMLIACMVDEDGNQISTHDDALSISEMLPVEVANRLFDACRRVNATLFESKESKKK